MTSYVLINEIRQLRNLKPQSIIASQEEEEIDNEKMALSFQNDTERIENEMGDFYDEDKVIEFIEHWDPNETTIYRIS